MKSALIAAALLMATPAVAQTFEPVTLDQQSFIALYNHANGIPTVHGRPIVTLLEELERKALADKAAREKPKDEPKKD